MVDHAPLQMVPQTADLLIKKEQKTSFLFLQKMNEIPLNSFRDPFLKSEQNQRNKFL